MKKTCDTCVHKGKPDSAQDCKECKTIFSNGEMVSGPTNWVGEDGTQKRPEHQPYICQRLGVKIGETFRIRGIDCSYQMLSDGTFETVPKRMANASIYLLLALETPELVEHSPEFSPEEEMMISLLYEAGVRWIGRPGRLYWYRTDPAKIEGNLLEDGQYGELPDELFPSVFVGVRVALLEE